MKDIIDAIDSRIRSPLFGYYIFAAIAINWEEWFFLIVHNGTVIERIEYVHNGTDIFSLFLYPFLVATTYSIIYPWLLYLFMYLATKPNELRNALQAQSEHKLLVKKQELEDARSQILKSAEEELFDRAKRDMRLEEIDNEDVRGKLQAEIEQLRKERDEIRGDMNAESNLERSSLSNDEEEILSLIALQGGSYPEQAIIEKSKFDKIKAEYYIESLEDDGYLHRNYDSDFEDYIISLTTKSKKIMVEKGIAK